MENVKLLINYVTKDYMKSPKTVSEKILDSQHVGENKQTKQQTDSVDLSILKTLSFYK